MILLGVSKAFTREENEGPELPDLPLPASVLPAGAKNYMTRSGADELRAELTRLMQNERSRAIDATDDHEAKRRLAKINQRIFQIEQSLRSAEVVLPEIGVNATVRFGATVTVREENGVESTYRIVGVDEADPDRGWASWLSPIARALLNSKLGERVRFKFPSGEEELEITRINYE